MGNCSQLPSRSREPPELGSHCHEEQVNKGCPFQIKWLMWRQRETLSSTCHHHGQSLEAFTKPIHSSLAWKTMKHR